MMFLLNFQQQLVHKQNILVVTNVPTPILLSPKIEKQCFLVSPVFFYHFLYVTSLQKTIHIEKLFVTDYFPHIS